MKGRPFSWRRALAFLLILILVRRVLSGTFKVGVILLYSPLGWVVMWVGLIQLWLFLHPRAASGSPSRSPHQEPGSAGAIPAAGAIAGNGRA